MKEIFIIVAFVSQLESAPEDTPILDVWDDYNIDEQLKKTYTFETREKCDQYLLEWLNDEFIGSFKTVDQKITKQSGQIIYSDNFGVGKNQRRYFTCRRISFDWLPYE